jgi:hypothetical protein
MLAAVINSSVFPAEKSCICLLLGVRQAGVQFRELGVIPAEAKNQLILL